MATIALHYKLPIGVQEMRDLAGTDRIGTNLLGLAQAAEKLGFSAKGVKGPYEGLSTVPLPAIAHTRTEEGLGHFVVLHRVGKKGVVVSDPARGILKYSKDDFCKRWTGYLLLVVPEKVVKRSGSTSPSSRFMGLLSAHTGILVQAFLCAVLLTVLGISTSYFVQHLVDSVLVRGEHRLLNALAVGMIAVAIFRTLFGVFRGYLLAHVSRTVDLSLISGYSRHILNLPMRFFEMRRVGEILSRVNDAGKIREAISGTTLTAVVDGTLVILSTIVLWLYDVPLALVATAFVPLLLISVAVHHPSSKKRSREAMEQGGQLSAHLVEDVSGVETVKAFGLERPRSEEGESRLVKFVQSLFSLQKLGLSMSSAGLFVTAIAGIVILWYGGYRVADGALTIGQLMFFYTLLGYLLGPLERLASINLKMQDALVAVDRLFQVLDLEQEESSSSKKAAFSEIEKCLEIKDLSFRYGCRAKVLEKVNLRIPAGKTVAIVGESGSGKSTLGKLLMRFYDPTEGSVLVDGVDLRDFSVSSLRSGIGLVSQDPFLFTGTLRENIALGRPDATVEEIIEAARAAGLVEFIASLPERFETVVGERGANLSGGQRQRLAIARALIRKPELLIFDEATSHLDTATERAIQESLKSAFQGKTVLLIAHRLSTIREADCIYVLRNGKIVEEGSHRELLEQEGWYASLWRAQTEERNEPFLLVDGAESNREEVA